MAQQPGKSGDALKITRDYYDSLLIEMRHLDGVKPDTAMMLFGESFATPIMTAALSHLHKGDENGLILIAQAAASANAVMWCGMGSEAELEAIVATGAKTVKIIKPYADRNLVLRKMEHAAKCGALAVGMDIDHQFRRDGNYDNIEGNPMFPVSAKELEAFVKDSKLPFIVKGVLSEQDALKCADAGAAGIVISHHNGLIPYAVPPLMVLPGIARAVKGRMKIFVDCGIGSGADAFKALALGADAVCVGKPLMEAMMQSGPSGVSQIISSFTEALAGIMARTCSKDISSIDQALIHPGYRPL